MRTPFAAAFRAALLALVLLASGFVPVFAQPVFPGADRLKELRQAIEQYAKTNVVPQLLAWKTTFDRSMSAEDLAALNKLRSQATALRDAAEKEAAAIRAAIAARDTASARAHREKLRPMREQLRALSTSAAPFADKYKTTLEAVGKEFDGKRPEWVSQVKTIVGDWMKKNNITLPPFAQEMMKGFVQRFLTGRQKDVASLFLLWDGTLPKFEGFAAAAPGAGEGASIEVRTFPNPATHSAAIRLTLPSAETVTLSIYDAWGNEVAVLAREARLAAGEHEFSVAVADFAAGAYLCKIATPTATRSQRLVIAR